MKSFRFVAKTLSNTVFSAEAQQHAHGPLVLRVAASQCFQSSMRMKEVLFYVADCALRDCPEEATEQQIGIHVFGRLPGFNSGEDSIVRTQARALRQKLTEYFSHEGIDEEIVIEIPKGHYLPVFQPRLALAESSQRTSVLEPPLAEVTSRVEIASADGKAPQRRRWMIPLLLLVSAAMLSLGYLLFGVRNSAVDRFWGPFLADNGSLVIYSNAVFMGDSTNGLKYASSQTGSVDADHLVDTYTGIGELASVYYLTRLFDEHHAVFTLKRSLLVTWDQAQMSNLIFIGSVAENPSLRVLPPNPDFTMTAAYGVAGFVNHRPKTGESAFYGRPEHPFLKDYAMLALLPGLQNGKKVLVFSGLTTLGTQAAVEFASRPDSLEQLLSSVSGPHGEVRPFEALIETTIGGGVPFQSRLVSVHTH